MNRVRFQNNNRISNENYNTESAVSQLSRLQQQSAVKTRTTESAIKTTIGESEVKTLTTESAVKGCKLNYESLDKVIIRHIKKVQTN